MNNLQKIDKKGLLIKPEEYLRDKSQLPPHITLEEYRKLREAIFKYWEDKKRFSPMYQQIVNRDVLFVDYLWETGGRVGDITNFTFKDFEGKVLNLYTKKRKKNIPIDISSDLYADTLTYMKKFIIKDEERLFPFTIQRGWQIVKQYANGISFPTVVKIWEKGQEVNSTLRPHLFRHGMAINLFNQGVRIEVISARLGHSNIRMTMDMYLKVTPEIQHIHLQNVQWR